MPGLSGEARRRVVNRIGVCLVAAVGCAMVPAHGQNATGALATKTEPLHHLELRAGGGWTAPVGGTGGIMDQGWNVGGGVGFRFTHRIGLMLNGQFQQAGIGSNVLTFDLIPNGNYRMWTGTLDPVFTYWQRGKYSGYVTGGGGYSRILTTFNWPSSGAQCYFFCSNTPGPGGFMYHYSSNQPVYDGGLGFTMRPWRGHRWRAYAEARYEDLMENSDLAPYRNVQVIPVTVGVEW